MQNQRPNEGRPEFLGEDLGARYAALYHEKLKTGALTKVPGISDAVVLNSSGLVTDVTPLSIIFGWDIMCDELHRRCPALESVVSTTHGELNAMVHGYPSDFDGVYADVGLLVQGYVHDHTSNPEMTLDLRRQLGLISESTTYHPAHGKDIPIFVDSRPEAHFITSLNNVEAVPDSTAHNGIRYKFRHPDTVPETEIFKEGSLRRQPFSLCLPAGTYHLPEKFTKWNASEESAFHPREYGVMRMFVYGPQGLKLGGPNLTKSTNEGRMFVVEGGRKSKYQPVSQAS